MNGYRNETCKIFSSCLLIWREKQGELEETTHKVPHWLLCVGWCWSCCVWHCRDSGLLLGRPCHLPSNSSQPRSAGPSFPTLWCDTDLTVSPSSFSSIMVGCFGVTLLWEGRAGVRAGRGFGEDGYSETRRAEGSSGRRVGLTHHPTSSTFVPRYHQDMF